MTKKLETRLEIISWDENPYRELPDGRKFTRAEVQLKGTGGELASGAFEALMYYRPDGTGTYVTLMSVSGTLDGRTGELAGLTGQGTSRSTHADYPHMPLTVEYDLG